MSKKLNAFFVIALILFSMFPVQAVAPITYNKELSADTSLVGALFTDGDATGFFASYVGDSIQITSTNHYTDKTIKIKGTALTNRLKMYDGLKVGYTHIADDGTVTHEIKSLVIDKQGFAYLTADFSTVIISGMTGTTTTTHTSQSGNQSFSVPDGSSYDLNITNNQLGVWTAKSDIGGNESTFEYKVPYTINHSGALTDYQLLLNGTINDSVRFGADNGDYIPLWNETTDGASVKANFSDGDNIVWMYYGNAGLNSGSDGDSVFDFFDDFTGTLTDKWNRYQFEDGVVEIISNELKIDGSADWNKNGVTSKTAIARPSVITWKQRLVGGGIDGALGYSTAALNSASGLNYIPANAGGLDRQVDGSSSSLGSYSTGTDSIINSIIIKSTAGYQLIWDDVSKEDSASWTTDNNYIAFQVQSWGRQLYIDYVMVRQYTATEPTYTIGAAQQASGTANITASVTGDNNTQTYNTSQSRAFTLTPTGTTNFVNITTTSTDYDITITTYWTEDTTLQSETATAGYAKQYINYTPSSDITSADLKTTFDFVFADQDYIGTTTSTLNDVSKPTTRVGQDINASVGSLTANTSYWWNVTVPYNNVFTLSNQSNYTVGFGDVVSFIDSNYSDPEGLAIDTIYWQFGDGNTSTASNPTHQYSSAGNYTANVTVTETATVSPQSITKGFYVFVLPSYDVSGYVFDTDNNPLGLALISNNQTTEEVYTNISGYYILSDLYAGSILINATKSSFSNGSTISNVVDTHLYNQNITLSAIEYTSLEIMNKLLDIEALLTSDFNPEEGNYEMLSSTYNIFLVLLGACFVLSFPKRGEVTERDTGLNNVLFSFIGTILSMFLAQIIVSGQVVESFEFTSQIYDPLQHYLLYFVAIIMFVIFIMNAVNYIKQRWD